MSEHQSIGVGGAARLSALLGRSFKRHSRRPALSAGDVCLSYADLWQHAASIAQTLQGSVKPVALIGTRSWQDYAAVLAIFLSGRTYVPLNANESLSNLESFLRLSGTSTVLCSRETPLFASLQRADFNAVLLEQTSTPTTVPPPATSPYAYIVATSGSSGPPKAVPISHSNLLAYLNAATNALDISPADRVSQIFDLCFDLSLHDILVSWLCGAHLCVAQQQDAMDLKSFAKRHRLTVWFSTPSHARKALLRSETKGPLDRLRLSMFCGEPLTWGLAAKWAQQANGQLENWYGPSEATIACTRYVLPPSPNKNPSGMVPIGTSFGSLRHAISNTGELYLGGPQVFDGYLGLRRRGRTLYATGDIVSRDPSGRLQFKRRKGTQIKLNGRFVDLRDIEAQIASASGLEVAVLPWPHGILVPESLVAAVAQNGPLSVGKVDLLRKAVPLGSSLRFVSVSEMPLTVAGKRDDRALAQLVDQTLQRQTRKPAKRIDRLIALAQEANPSLAATDLDSARNLMEAGLDSLAFTGFVARLEAAFKINLSQSDVAQLSQMTLRQILLFLRKLMAKDHEDAVEPPPTLDYGQRRAPHYRALRAVDFLEKFPAFLGQAGPRLLPFIGSSGFMRALDCTTIDQTLNKAGIEVRSANIGMAMLSNAGICEFCAHVASLARQRGIGLPLAVLEMELLQLSVLPPAGDIEVLSAFKAGHYQGVVPKRGDPDTGWDSSLSGSLREHQGPWRPRDAPAVWESKRHAEIRDIYSGNVSLDPNAVKIWFEAINHLLSVSPHVVVVLHPLDGYTSGLLEGRGHLATLTERLETMPNVVVLRDEQFSMNTRQFRNFSHLNARDGRQSFSTQLAQHLASLLEQGRS